MAEESWEELERSKSIWKNHALFFRLLRGLVLIALLGLIGVAIYTSDTARESFSVNVFTAVMSAVATALIFDELNRKRSQDEYKRQLVDDAASTSNEKAKDAVHQLRRKGWLVGEDGLLKGTDLFASNLQGAVLYRANLQDVDLRGAKLQNAVLTSANLRRATLGSAVLIGSSLIEADLRQASLVHADLSKASLINTDMRWANLETASLQEANLTMANLQGVRMEHANLEKATLSLANMQRTHLDHAILRGANLTDANLQDADLVWAKFDVDTILPDGNSWTHDTDMSRFTNPEHPNFWRSKELASPAYLGGELYWQITPQN